MTQTPAPDTSRPGNETTLRCTIRRVRFAKENGWCVLDVRGDTGEHVVVGVLPGVTRGITIEASGVWTDSKYGRQFNAGSFIEILPRERDGLAAYLASGVLPGVGKATARRIVDTLGTDAVDKMDADINCIAGIRGISKPKLEKIAAAWQEGRQRRRSLVFMQQLGLTSAMANRVYDYFGDTAQPSIKNNPYDIALVDGIGFATADTMAARMGISGSDSRRCMAACMHMLELYASDGHVFATRKQLAQGAAALIKVPQSDVLRSISRLEEQRRIVAEGDAVYLRDLHAAETGAAEALIRLLEQPLPKPRKKAPAKTPPGFVYDPLQLRAIDTALTSKVSVLTGGPGTGKTSTVRGILSQLRANGEKVLLVAPTGRAAKRLSQATGMDAATIHRLLEAGPTGFERNENNKIEGDTLVVDESSMLDISLFHSLLAAMPGTMRLIMCGDVDQLPSVGPGNVLADIIASGIVPVTRLERVFRQAEHSHIVTNAHLINSGSMPVDDRSPDSDFFIMPAVKELLPELIADLVSHRLPAKYGINPFDIQVLTPLHAGDTGTDALNERLRDALNPKGRKAGEFRIGDKVIQTVNNYELQVFNGDIGIVKSFSATDDTLTVSFDERDVKYSDTDCGDLAPAYAITVHKSQGSEFPVVVMPVLRSRLLKRNLIYTAVTRARRLCILAGDMGELASAVAYAPDSRRNTRLAQRLAQGISEALLLPK